MNTKRSAILGLVMIVAVALAGCTASGGGGGSSPTASGGGASGTVTFAGQTSEQAIWAPLFASFQKAYPNITVNATYSPNTSYPQLIQTELQSGNAADVIQTTPGTGGGLAALTLAAGGQLADLSGESWVKTLPASTKPLVTLDGKAYAYPTDVAPLFVAYNPALFKKVGVSVPKTFSDLTASCSKFNAAGLIPISMAGASFQNTSIMLQTIAANEVFGPVPDWNKQRESGKTTFANSKEWQDVLSKFKELKDKKCFSPDVAGVQAPVHDQQFAAQQSAMTVMPAQAISIVRSTNKDLDFSAFAFPADKAADTKVSASSGIAIVVNKKAKNLAAAKQLIEYLSQPKQRLAYANAAGTIAPGAGPNGADVIPPTLEPLKPYLAPDKVLTLNYLFWPSAKVAQALATSSQGILTGQKTSDQVLSDTDQAWNTSSK